MRSDGDLCQFALVVAEAAVRTMKTGVDGGRAKSDQFTLAPVALAWVSAASWWWVEPPVPGRGESTEFLGFCRMRDDPTRGVFLEV